MSLEFFLSDFENVQFTDIGLLKPGACRIKVFLGQKQSKLSIQLVQALQRFGPDVEYIQITGTGPNALDFHIAFYIGCLAAEYPGSGFTIISGDTGFDPLIAHLAGRGIACKRIDKIHSALKPAIVSVAAQQAATPKPKIVAAKNAVVAVLPVANGESSVRAIPMTTKSRVAEALKRLNAMKTNKPKTVAALESSIKSWFKSALNDKQFASVIQSLVDSKKVVLNGAKVTYAL